MWLWTLLTLGFVLLLAGILRRATRDRTGGRVLEVRRTPRRVVEEMTVAEFRELGRGYLRSRGMECRTGPEGTTVAMNEQGRWRVFFDPASEAADPRYLNRLVVQLRRGEHAGGWLITSARLDERARGLAERGGLRVADPAVLIAWRRDREKTASRHRERGSNDS